MTFKLSPSSLNLMEECPRCFWLTQHKVWKRPAGIFPSLPNGIDKILKIHFDKFMNKGKLPPELCNNEYCENMKLFDDEEKLQVWRSNFKGVQYTDENGNILHGAVDNILVKNGKLIVLDYKTRGYPLKDDTAHHYQNQMNFYNFLLRKNDYETEDYAFLLFYISKEITETGEFIFDTELVKRDVNVNSAESIFINAIKLLNETCPEKSCEWCKFFSIKKE
jgi:hypothetical protein